ncbi:MAG: hypothetical protein EKK54_02425 [Neisseriaceae bacterium]|nr:MAG: hypothetical protein EKK54_02425 [Neisseriaceae bacterium]
MSELFSGICGGIVVFILTIFWDIWKGKHESRLYQIKLKNDIYVRIFEMFQLPIEKFSQGSPEQISWYLEMEKLHLRLAVLGEKVFILEYLKYFSPDHDSESSKFDAINKL